MSRSRRIAALATAALLAAAAAALPARAQEPPPGPGREEIEDLRETVHLLMLSRLKRAVPLTEEQGKNVVPLLDQLDEARRDHMRQRREALREMRRLLESPKPSEADLTESVRRAREMRLSFESMRRKIEEQVAAQLSVEQQARMMIFMQDFRRDLRQQLRGHRGRRPGMGPPGRPGRAMPPPAEGDDWDEESL